MIARVANQLRWSLRKNWPDIRGLAARHYPGFVLSNAVTALGDEIPVFVFHSVEPVGFKKQLAYLRNNHYRTLSGPEFAAVLRGEREAPERSVVLTFDDGTASLFTVAQPLLQAFEFHAIAFLIPGCIPDTAPESPRYADFLAGRATAAELLRRERSDAPLCSWEELQEIHAGGRIDLQAHTMYHHLIQVSPRLVDFIHPGYDFYFFANIHVPVYYTAAQPDYRRSVPWGTPVCRAEPRMCGLPQYFDDEGLREACIEFVRMHGGTNFFGQRSWRKQLYAFYRREARRFPPGTVESPAEMRATLFNDLLGCKSVLEQKFPDHRVEHFCFPWFIGSALAVELAARAGYKMLYWGIRSDTRINRPGSDAQKIVRLEDRYIFRLPGEGRRPLRALLSEKIGQNLPAFLHRVDGNDHRPSVQLESIMSTDEKEE